MWHLLHIKMQQEFLVFYNLNSINTTVVIFIQLAEELLKLGMSIEDISKVTKFKKKNRNFRKIIKKHVKH